MTIFKYFLHLRLHTINSDNLFSHHIMAVQNNPFLTNLYPWQNIKIAETIELLNGYSFCHAIFSGQINNTLKFDTHTHIYMYIHIYM